MAETGYQLKGNAAQQYERDIVPMLSRPQTEVVFEHVSLHEGERVLDVACGTGIVLRLAVERFGNIKSIAGVDINRGMLDIAKELTPTTNIPIEWREGDVCELPFPDKSFEVALCSQGVQFFPDKSAALHDVQRVLVSDGRLIFTIWSTPHPPQAALAELLTRHVNAEAAAECLAPFVWSDAAVIRQLVADVGFVDIEMAVIESPMRMSSSAESVSDFIKVIAARSKFTREIEACLTVLEQELSQALQPHRVGDEFVMIAKSHLVQARSG